VLLTITPALTDAGEWLKKTLPTARVEVFADAGHFLFVDDPDHFNSVVDAFTHDAFHAPAARKD
jgi:pimeloyl-ACP methyl ester carboxylesterase